jgi:hypothetical protein
MSNRFSNFETETDDSDLPLPSITGKTTFQQGNTRQSSNGEKVKAAVETGGGFDDFDEDWDSNGSAAPQRSVSPLLPVSNGHHGSNLGVSASLGSRNASPSYGDEGATLALPRSSDLERRAHALDLDEHFGRERSYASKSTQKSAEQGQRSTAGMTLRDFSSSERETPPRESSRGLNDSKGYRAPFSDAEDARNDAHMPTMPQIQYEPFSVEPPSHYQNYLYLLKYIHGLKILCGLHMIYTIIAIVFKVWYLLGGLIVAPFGFLAVHKLDRKLILLWGIAFVIDTLAEAIGALVYSGKPSDEGGGVAPTLVHMTVVLMRAGLTYLIYRFWTKLPENAAEYFALFTSSPEIDHSEMV